MSEVVVGTRPILISEWGGDDVPYRSSLELTKRIISGVAMSSNVEDLLAAIVCTAMDDRGAKSALLISSGLRNQLLADYGLSLLEKTTLTEVVFGEPSTQAIRTGSTLFYADAEEFLHWNPHWAQDCRFKATSCVLVPIQNISEQLLLWINFKSPMESHGFTEENLELLRFTILTILIRDRSPKRTIPVSRLELTDREIAVTELVSRGATNYQVARRLNISESWVKKILQIVFMKLGIHSRQDLVLSWKTNPARDSHPNTSQQPATSTNTRVALPSGLTI